MDAREGVWEGAARIVHTLRLAAQPGATTTALPMAPSMTEETRETRASRGSWPDREATRSLTSISGHDGVPASPLIGVRHNT
ncbi:hypothetical protein G7Z17_g11045 [Cylindrodendrum hubeiense]|uniref:Uncharacterized protein n=1 Tax=Cylindrodendrum hubeiense TaxID=595255 RepID=A0A9P5GWL1_9HYPO|nr:hypothetical protein G7Z17_g11045 [Cylindrodendrum hubeiense]